jgi:acyl-coenzyme A synthetase/AMP-(fatty) acid ligase
MNIVDPILFQCRYHPPAAAICAPGSGLDLVSYARLERLINNASRMAAAAGLARGNTVSILIGDVILNAAVTLGLMRIGVITVEGRSNMPRELALDAVITDGKMPAPFMTKKIIVADASWTSGEGRPLDDKRLYQTGDDDICRLILTSGTTGEPKAVALTHRMLALRIARHPYLMGNRLSRCDRIYCDFGLGTSLGFQFLIYVLWKGGTVFLSGGDADAAMQAFDLYKVQALAGSPACLAAFTRFYEMHSPFQSSFEMAIAGGSQLLPSLSLRARARLCPNIIAAYGATETSMVATAPAYAIADVEGAVGYVTPDVTVEIVDGGKAVAPGQEGVIRIRSPYGVNSYHRRDNAPDEVFRDGWFYPGDTGRVTADGLLIIAGREQTVMNIGGDKVKPETIEAAMASYAGIEDVAVTNVKNDLGVDQIWAIVVPRPNYSEQALAAHCRSRLQINFVPVRYVSAPALPKNEMGKTDRPRMLQLLPQS